jgi:sugar-phosphatase
VTNPGGVRAVIFDMDGVLVDSEPFWVEAEQAAFARVGLDLRPEDMANTIGLRIEEVARYWYRRRPWEGPAPEEVALDVLERVVELVRERGRPMPGARRALDRFASRGLPMAVASSSSGRLIRFVLGHLGLDAYFAIAVSAEDESHGKPHPAVFLTAAAKLGVEPQGCLVIEDSINGVIAAKAARMKCLAIPDPRQRDDPRLVLADEVLGSLEDLDDAVFSRW